MGRILAIDYGKKRCGLAWTDPLMIAAHGLPTVQESELKPFLLKSVSSESIEEILLGYPTRMDGSDSHVTEEVRELEKWLSQQFPNLSVIRWDERLSSVSASRALVEAGISKKKRREKGALDQMAATLMLQEYLQSKGGGSWEF